MLSYAAISGKKKNIKAALGSLSIQIFKKLPVKLNRCRSSETPASEIWIEY